MNFTPKQLKVLQLVQQWRRRHGFSPTMQELADELGVSKVTAFEHVGALIEKGALERTQNKARSLKTTEALEQHEEALEEDRQIDESDSAGRLQFPLVGRVAAGYPMEKFEQRDKLSLEELFGPRRGQKGNTFALQVEGESMRDEGILDGDYVLIEQRSTARNGERVVAILPSGETTLKTLYREADGRIRLQPSNPEFAPIIVDHCEVQGIVIGVLRSYR